MYSACASRSILAIFKGNSDDPAEVRVARNQRDKFSKLHVEPLLLDKALESPILVGRRGRNKLLKLPSELLNEITEYLTSRGLAALACCSWTCCQLARCRQFTRVAFDFSAPSRDLARKLLVEAKERNEHGHTLQPSLGVCIRYFTVDTNSDHFAESLGIDLDEEDLVLEWELEQYESMRDRWQSHYYTTIYALCSAFRHRAMPNLWTLRWLDQVPLTEYITNCLLYDGIQNLELIRSRGPEIFIPHVMNMTKGTQSLLIDIWQPRFDGIRTNPLLLIETALRVNFDTLTRLECAFGKESSIHELSSPNIPTLTALQEVKLFNSTIGISLQLAPSMKQLRTLCLGSTINGAHLESLLGKCGTMYRLTTLACGPTFTDQIQNFLMQNRFIKNLKLSAPLGKEDIEMNLLPLLGRYLTNLASLDIQWTAQDIPTTSLILLNKLSSLEQLHVTTGADLRGEDLEYFAPDHDKFVQNLSGLNRLRGFAMTGDSYNFWDKNETDFPYYTGNRIMPDLVITNAAYVPEGGPTKTEDEQTFQGMMQSLPEELTSPEHVHEHLSGTFARVDWRKQHSYLMLEKAQIWHKAFPHLQWLSFGRLLFKRTQKSTDPFRVHPDLGRTDWMDEAMYKKMRKVFLEQKFGWPHTELGDRI